MPSAAPMTYGIGLGEFQDALKVIPICLLQGLVQMMFYKQKFSHRFMKNIIDAVAVVVGANIVQRNLSKPIASGAKSAGTSSGQRSVYRF